MRASIQLLGLGIMLIIGIFLGIDTAEKNIQKLEGVEGSPRAIQITPQQNGKIEISVMGQVVETKNPVENLDDQKIKEASQKVKGTIQNETSQLALVGNHAGTAIRQITRKLVESIFSWAN
ncbi:DUF3679 domain-containing protein [Hazenella coriacea]|uniref:Uncharacterized protein DUF3679 n=1 Tax=Hazenella coriacea TaxID=1179467 RepID=A0A4R3L770_9BACL|nr:DUF3679 domain-containing protein [Hazenella coriacea]TCS94780.1 uncharacterized protein DUF3679 [Hazenella coriacea]